ncbi:MAG: hypothetical protein ACI4F5_05995 [Acutalibacteraceae bacterium]
MKKARIRFISAQSLNIISYLIIVISTICFSDYEYYWLEFLFTTSYGFCVTFVNIFAIIALIIGFFFSEKREKHFLYKLSWFYFAAIGVEVIITLPTMFLTVINLFVGVATIVAAVLQLIVFFMIYSYSAE